MNQNTPLIELTLVSKDYGSGKLTVRAVNQVSLKVMPGEMVLLSGPSGSGKTTLLSIVGTLLRPTSGTLFMAGKDMAALSLKELAEMRLRTFGFIFQDSNLISSLTAFENVKLVMELAHANTEVVSRRATELLTRFHLGHRVNNPPSQMSIGERQRVAIARALANNPKLILADEPTGSLDSKTGREVMLELKELTRSEGRGVLVASHDVRLFSTADRILWMEDGRVESKRANELLT
ncbi:MAG: ABC transporter ATP-binding protein [Dehalococcoidia bacterium]|nr:ABC transporter ATP-binding protein [Dehalococcoidia bacterium]